MFAISLSFAIAKVARYIRELQQPAMNVPVVQEIKLILSTIAPAHVSPDLIEHVPSTTERSTCSATSLQDHQGGLQNDIEQLCSGIEKVELTCTSAEKDKCTGDDAAQCDSDSIIQGDSGFVASDSIQLSLGHEILWSMTERDAAGPLYLSELRFSKSLNTVTGEIRRNGLGDIHGIVGVRFTTSKWETHNDIIANQGADRYIFEVKKAENADGIEFALYVQDHTGEKQWWDNNGGSNYKFCLN